MASNNVTTLLFRTHPSIQNPNLHCILWYVTVCPLLYTGSCFFVHLYSSFQLVSTSQTPSLVLFLPAPPPYLLSSLPRSLVQTICEFVCSLTDLLLLSLLLSSTGGYGVIMMNTAIVILLLSMGMSVNNIYKKKNNRDNRK